MSVIDTELEGWIASLREQTDLLEASLRELNSPNPRITRTEAAAQAATLADTPIGAPILGLDRAWDIRDVPAGSLQHGDIIHASDTTIDVVEVRAPIVPVVVRIDGRLSIVHCPAAQPVLASRPSGWDAPGAPRLELPAPPAPTVGPSRAEILAAIRVPRHVEAGEGGG